jgi:N-hydroxyarylamine O-acetyltransferase
MDTQKYLDRIRYYSAVTAPSLAVLDSLQASHLMSVPFENLDIHYGRKILLDIERIAEKIMNDNRGGFCYELNGLFYELLRSLGFKVKIISARGYNRESQSYGPEYDHLAVVATLDNRDYLADVGFGEFAFSPLLIELDTIQEDKRGNFRVEKHDDEYLKVSKQTGNKWWPEYVFSLKERSFTEFEQMCLYHQTSPLSHFTRNRLCSIPIPNGRITLTGDKLKITNGSDQTEQTLSTEEEFTAALLKQFNIKLNMQPVPIRFQTS